MTTFSNSRSYRLVSGYIHVNITDVQSQKKRKQKHQQNFSLKKNEYIQEKFVRYILVRMHTEN